MAAANSNRRRYNFKDLTGKPFGNWTVVCEVTNHPSRNHTYWLCRCICGTEKAVRQDNLTGNLSHGCQPCSNRRHGMEGKREYNSWRSMKQRCYNPNAESFPHYGQDGITICDGWKSFENFYSDMGMRPSASHSVDRINNSKGYSCGHCEECVANGWTANCRWATRAEQSRNRSCVRMITFHGETLCLPDWAVKVGINLKTLQFRFRRGWSIERALTQPVKGLP